MPNLEALDLVRRTGVSGNLKMYKLNKDSKTGTLLQGWGPSPWHKSKTRITLSHKVTTSVTKN
jgi:hypothetical protein